MKVFVVAGSNSGAGKTTVSLALMAAFARRGLDVQAFKVGPDFIDPGHHQVVTGRASHNLDGWMIPRKENLALFKRRAAGADICVIEGVMGLFDGYQGDDDAGSTAQMAKWLGAKVVLVVNARAMARSLAALAVGFKNFDPKVSFAGLIANFTGSPRHVDYLAQAMKSAPGMPFLGGLPRRPDLALPERHLGLITAQEGGLDKAARERLADWVEQSLDLDALLASLPDMEIETPEPETIPSPPSVRIALARDKAFCFYYEENLRLLRRAGAELVEFSPLRDGSLPDGVGAVYLGGGYPELFAEELSANRPMRENLKSLGLAGMPIYAECGGMMYLGRELNDLEQKPHPMTGLLPVKTAMLPKLRSLGYREVRFKKGNILGKAGAVAKGHEFHYSEMQPVSGAPGLDQDVYEVRNLRGEKQPVKGLVYKNTLASYLHLHFSASPSAAQSLVQRAARWKEESA